jgi:hypothetical protein
MRSYRLYTFLGSAVLSAAFLIAADSRAAAWIHASATTCEVFHNGSITTPGAPNSGGGATNTGIVEGAAGGGALQVICPVVDTSVLNLGSSTNFDNVAPVIFLPFSTHGTAQVCTDFVATTGGSCDAAVNSATTTGKTNWAVPTTNWQNNPNDYHFIWVSMPTQASGSASAFYGYSVFHS